MKAKQNSVRLILLIFSMLLCGPYVYSQNNKCDTTFYVKFDFDKYGRILDLNFISKFERNGMLEFAKGMDAIGEINNFYINGKKGKKRLSSAELKKISLTEIDDFVNYMLEHPTKKVKINIVEITLEKALFLYNDAKWERLIYIE